MEKIRVLVFGANSYIGRAVGAWLAQQPERYDVTAIGARTYRAQAQSFSGFDAIYFVAGIAHRKETPENAYLYYEVNRDLAVAVAEKAKREGVRHFVLMSSLAVYGLSEGVITPETPPRPTTHYGKSKLQADVRIMELADEKFAVAVLRPPMVYGRGCKGNYQTLRRLALKLPVFPKVQNRRSMIYIDNLCACVERILSQRSSGLFFPQNPEYVCTSDMVALIAAANGKRIFFSRAAGALVTRLPVAAARKAFGSLVCTMDEPGAAAVADFAQTVYMTEKKG